MDRRFSLAVLFLVACGLAFSPPAALARSDADEEQEEEVSNAKPDAGGIVIEPSSGKIAEGDTITITFPVAMVAADLIDVGDQPSAVCQRTETRRHVSLEKSDRRRVSR